MQMSMDLRQVKHIHIKIIFRFRSEVSFVTRDGDLNHSKPLLNSPISLSVAVMNKAVFYNTEVLRLRHHTIYKPKKREVRCNGTKLCNKTNEVVPGYLRCAT